MNFEQVCQSTMKKATEQKWKNHDRNMQRGNSVSRKAKVWVDHAVSHFWISSWAVLKWKYKLDRIVDKKEDKHIKYSDKQSIKYLKE